MTVKASQPSRKELRIGMLGCGFMGRCHSNAYKNMPYIYSAAGFAPRLAVLCDKQEEIVERRRPAMAMRSIAPIGGSWRPTTRIDVVDNCGPDPSIPIRALPPWSTANT